VLPGATPALLFEDSNLPVDWTRLSYVVKAIDSNPVQPNEVAYGSTQVSRVGTFLALTRNLFNPGRAETVDAILQVDGEASVTLRVYNLSGQLVRNLFTGTLSPGGSLFTRAGVDYAGTPVSWDGRNDAGSFVGPGVYVFAFRSDTGASVYTNVKKVAVVR
jgi:hypothetical protein